MINPIVGFLVAIAVFLFAVYYLGTFPYDHYQVQYASGLTSPYEQIPLPRPIPYIVVLQATTTTHVIERPNPYFLGYDR